MELFATTNYQCHQYSPVEYGNKVKLEQVLQMSCSFRPYRWKNGPNCGQACFLYWELTPTYSAWSLSSHHTPYSTDLEPWDFSLSNGETYIKKFESIGAKCKMELVLKELTENKTFCTVILTWSTKIRVIVIYMN